MLQRSPIWLCVGRNRGFAKTIFPLVSNVICNQSQHFQSKTALVKRYWSVVAQVKCISWTYDVHVNRCTSWIIRPQWINMVLTNLKLCNNCENCVTNNPAILIKCIQTEHTGSYFCRKYVIDAYNAYTYMVYYDISIVKPNVDELP